MERKRIMEENDYSFRDLYRIIEQSANNSVSDIQEKLDKAVMEAYGLKKSDDVLSFLLNLNLKLAEQDDGNVQASGLPKFVKHDNEFVTADCVEVPV